MHPLHSLTTSKAYQLRIQMADSRGRFAEAMYDDFELREDSANKTRITLATGKFVHLPYGLADDLARSNGAGFSAADYDAGGRGSCTLTTTYKAPWW